MYDLISNYGSILPIFSDEECENAIQELTSHMKNKLYYYHDRKFVYHKATISEDFSTKNLNQSIFIECHFKNSDLSRVSFVNSIFYECKFEECDLSSLNLRNSILTNCIFDSSNCFDNARLGKCRFVNCQFLECKLNSVSMDEAVFINSSFSANSWDSVSTADCKFENTTFDSVIFKNMNFEYSIFENIHMNNMKLPFPTIPYIFGGLQYLMSTDDKICVTSQHNIKHGISKEQYLDQLHNLEVFYSHSNNYFPLANIYIAEGEKEKCKAAILYGIEKSLESQDLRTIEYFSKLIKYNAVFTQQERQDLYHSVIAKVSQKKENDENKNRSILNFRMYLFNADRSSSVHVSIKTNTESLEHLSVIINYIEKCNKINVRKPNYNIEIRHNSPFEVFFNSFSDYESICYLVGTVLMVLKGVDIVFKKILEHANSILDLKKKSLENKLLEQQIEKNKNELSSIENTATQHDPEESFKQAANLRNEYYDFSTSIEITNISYIIITDEETIIIPPSDVFD
ncbi:MAG: pentapeptide repeat-containing protein [Erysipelotrichales bacterium]|nr:pentapeptide repeat-containing protein [Erysipelotrichales bacterium]